ncbi:uncharacterized protein LOC120300543 [Crotalus tigris]|uniref:uncharacterized protein LOC120300543 n=1 Tax=Crotalus tigris TaxID=88082 RepID=UPI00192F7798|nr:uncharacterized protein LOC120300543 [Crotalus tigris]
MGWLESALSWDTRTKLTSSKWTDSMSLTNPNSFSGGGRSSVPPWSSVLQNQAPDAKRSRRAGRCGEGRQALYFGRRCLEIRRSSPVPIYWIRSNLLSWTTDTEVAPGVLWPLWSSGATRPRNSAQDWQDVGEGRAGVYSAILDGGGGSWKSRSAAAWASRGGFSRGTVQRIGFWPNPLREPRPKSSIVAARDGPTFPGPDHNPPSRFLQDQVWLITRAYCQRNGRRRGLPKALSWR